MSGDGHNEYADSKKDDVLMVGLVAWDIERVRAEVVHVCPTTSAKQQIVHCTPTENTLWTKSQRLLALWLFVRLPFSVGRHKNSNRCV